MRMNTKHVHFPASWRWIRESTPAALGAALLAAACSGSSSPSGSSAGGSPSGVGSSTSTHSGTTQPGAGGDTASGGAQASGGNSATASHASGTGGKSATVTGGSSSSGGQAGTGGNRATATGGASSTGGKSTSGGTSSNSSPATGGVTATGGQKSSTVNTGAGGATASTGGSTAIGGTTSNATGGAGIGGTTSSDTSAAVGPCDIYKSGNTPCVAAYSTVRALYGAYTGNLYQVKKKDGTTKDIGPLSPGGVADSAAQDAFCPGSGSCTISIIYDQSGNGNHLTKAPGGSEVYGPNDDVEAIADALPVKLGSHKVYGVHVVASSSWTSPGQVGYRNTNTKNIPKGDNPESEYMVTDGTYYNASCCFDFGNAEMKAVAGGYGTMEAIYFGTCDWWDKGAGNGPWIMADLEVGVYSWGGPSAYSDANKSGNRVNPNAISFKHPFVTAMLKGNSSKATNGGPFTLKGGNAQSGELTTVWDGEYPLRYGSPMQRQGGIVLGIGGDNSSTAQGNFFEGVMTAGYATTATDNAVQANIVAAGYSK